MYKMSCRRSTRLAAKGSTADDKGSELVYEQTNGQQFNLKSRTPRGSTRCGLTRKAVKTPQKDENVGLKSDSTQCFDSPKVLTQNQFQNGPTDDGNLEDGPSIGNDESLLRAINQLEEKHLGTRTSSVPPERPRAQDLFPSENGIECAGLEVFLPTPPNEQATPVATPTTGRKRSRLSSKQLDAVSTNLENVNNLLPTNDVETGNGIEPKPKKSRRKSNGEKKTGKKSAAGGGAKKKKKNSKFKLAFTNRKDIRELANSASNELSKDDISSMTFEEKLLLSSWGLPSTILSNYHKKGITSLFNWQLECLANEKVLEGKNLLYSAPTSAGKTLVSEILMIKRVLELGRKAIMILPFVSVAREKVYSLQSIFGDAGVRVEGFMGSVNPPGGFKAVDVAVCTIEKANSLVNKLLEEDGLADLGTLVVDELHLIGDPHRGYLLELLLTKILYMTSVKNQSSENSMNLTNSSWKPKKYHIQVVGMSATLPNLDLLAKWLNAELYVTDFRPVPLKELLKVENEMLDAKLEQVREVKIEDIPVKIDGDTDDIIYLTLETILNGFSVLIFCPTKSLVEKTAERIALQFFNIGEPTNTQHPDIGMKLRSQLNGVRIKSVLEQLKHCPGGVDDVLARTVMFGIGYHHAGLTYENRDIVESAFKRGVLKVIVATSTLSAGVNLPARRVMIVSPMFNGSLLDTMTYRQMCGRAGRNGIDTEGESILICPSNMREKGIMLYKGSMPMVRSALFGDESLTSAMKRALLEAIASGITTLTTDVRSYARCTFLFHSIDNGLYHSEELSCSQINKESTVEDCLKYLETQDFIRIKQFEDEDKPDEYMPTQLGSACLASSLSPDDGIIVYKELLKARECFVLENELHVIYQVTPIYVSDTLRYIDWNVYLHIWEGLDFSEKKVANLIGIKEGFIIRAMIGTVSWKNPSQRSDMAIHQRFYAALALSDLVNEKSLDFVARKYGLNKGVLQNLQQAASTFAGMITAFCGRLGWSNLELLLSQFQERLEFGVQRELCDLVRLDCLNGQRARILYEAGLKTVVELAATDAAHVEHILHKATPFKSDVHGGRESSVWMIGKDSLTEAEAAQKIVNQARLYIQIELGQRGNIQFAFANNEIVSTPEKGNESQGEHTSNKTLPQSSNKSDDEADAENVNSAGDFKKPIINIIDKPSSREEKVEIDVETDLIFSQRPLELEASLQVVDRPSSKMEKSQDMFEESFPEIVVTNLSALYPKTVENPETPKTFSIQQHIDKIDSQHHSQHHSTPLNRRLQRFTLKPDEQTSPVRSLDMNEMYVENGGDDDPFQQGQNVDGADLTDGVLAELDHDFESSDGDKYENVVFHSSDFEVKASRESDTESVSKPNPATFKLSESDAAAMLAIADDSNFESEELFPTTETHRSTNNKDDVDCASEHSAGSPVPVTTSISKPMEMDHMLDGLDEEDFIMTQAQSASDPDPEPESETFEDSSEETENSESNGTRNDTEDDTIGSALSPEPAQDLVIFLGSRKVFAKIATSAEQIPDEFFTASDMLGIGLRTSLQKKSSSTSLAGQGIGAKILGKSASKTKIDLNDPSQQNSFALFNGADAIWVVPWVDYNEISVGSKRKRLDLLLSRIKFHNCALTMFKSKDKLKSLVRSCSPNVLRKLPSGEHIWDPQVAQWLWEFNEDSWNITEETLVEEYISPEDKAISSSSWAKEILEAFFSWHVMQALRKKLQDKGLWSHFTETEMPSELPLMVMELNGFGLDASLLAKLKQTLQYRAALLELHAFQLAGKQFMLGSPKDVKQVLCQDMGLAKLKSTGKEVLSKLDHEIGPVIVEWRKIEKALGCSSGFQQERNLDTGRVHGQYSHFTVTGRVIMYEPSLQTIPRDFDLNEFSFTSTDIKKFKALSTLKFGSKLASLCSIIESNGKLVDPSILTGGYQISMRKAFVPCSSDFVILAADYSQLELRIMAHLSEDDKLLEALNLGTDVFIEIASKWKKIPKEKVTSSMRQDAKAIVYGVMYGMSPRSLSEAFEIDERDAVRFSDQFMRIYSNVSRFIADTKNSCREKGYIETISGRRRYLPWITSLKPNERAKAERQAVNSQIQGSAADLVKKAMTRIHSALSIKYPESSLPIDWAKKVKTTRTSFNFGSSQNGATGLVDMENVMFIPILNLHDELIYEVRRTHLREIAEVIKREMETCLKLRVKLPVVLKSGESWGSLVNYDLN